MYIYHYIYKNFIAFINWRNIIFFLARGKGDYFRLGHGEEGHVRKPQLIEGLRGKKIIHVAVGALHCLAVADNGQVLCTYVCNNS